MTPLQIEILLHCHVSGGVEPSGPRVSVEEEAITYFLENDLVEACGDYYSTTDKGDALVSHICSLPLPTKTWIIKQ